MDSFQKYIKELPDPLDKAEQDTLLYEYIKTQNEQIREKLIYHNLIFCARYAINYCSKNDIMDKVEDINSICIMALVKAIEEYAFDKGASFSTFAYMHMNYGIKSDYYSLSKDVLNDALHISQLTEEGEDVDEDRLTFLHDSSESHIDEDFGGECFVNDLMNFIDSWDDNMRIAYKMFCGIGGYEKTSKRAIGLSLGVTWEKISKYIFEGEKLIRDYIATHYSSSYPQIKRKTTDTYWQMYNRKYSNHTEDGVECEDDFSMDKKLITGVPLVAQYEYEYNSYYGLNGYDKKTQLELAKELRIGQTTVALHIKKYKEYLENFQNNQIVDEKYL